MELTRELGTPAVTVRRGPRQEWPNLLAWYSESHNRARAGNMRVC